MGIININPELKSAVISSCGKFRYLLSRGACLNPLVFVMLNPSIADAYIDDPTIKRCKGFASLAGFDGIIVVNLYAYRATNPKEVFQFQDPVGTENDAYILEVAAKHKNIVCAWGSNAEKARAEHVLSLLNRADAKIFCLGLNKNGSPKHPLYIPSDQNLIKFA
ncbi:TPA: DUF1643 domain-containing protein [Acinetobacter baumannii]|uniref:DUF1643 domain-containing protein n=1 Tax=Acinetobacter baumannii TaxID=470 RepID=UPI001D17C266|nr:DUF1643 domain-containing protein [Acinetobacter baumannii]MCX3035292.1 DUF1643 domain-containing protein [Acinetobacter baumannii]